MGNHRNAITKESLGVNCIAIGVPTVVDAATIVVDALDKLYCNEPLEIPENLDDEQRKAITDLNNMYVTSKDIDETIKRLSFMISEAINMAFAKVS